jgi:hypothetical protein
MQEDKWTPWGTKLWYYPHGVKGFVHGMHVAVYELGLGRFILNTLNIESNLGKHPAAERLLRNMLNYAAGESKPTSEKPEGGIKP